MLCPVPCANERVSSDQRGARAGRALLFYQSHRDIVATENMERARSVQSPFVLFSLPFRRTRSASLNFFVMMIGYFSRDRQSRRKS